MKKIKTAFIMNVCLFVLETFAVAWMMSGISGGLLTSSRLGILKYFTVDSNILMGIIALVAAIDEWRVFKGKQSEVRAGSYVLKLIGTVGVTLTMLVTVFFLAPTTANTYGFFALFHNSNFFLHLFNPVLSLIVFLGFEKTAKIRFKHTFSGIIPMAVYAVYYVTAALTHAENGVIAAGYDWYGFFFGGVTSVLYVLPALLLITYAISFVLWKLNRRKA